MRQSIGLQEIPQVLHVGRQLRVHTREQTIMPVNMVLQSPHAHAGKSPRSPLKRKFGDRRCEDRSHRRARRRRPDADRIHDDDRSVLQFLNEIAIIALVRIVDQSTIQ